MNDYDASTYGDGVADVYDGWYSGGDVAPIVGRLAELAGDGPVLELGIGTGRVALPLAERGLAVHGIDASSAMVEKLRAKPGGADQDDQVRCFRNVAARLVPGGRFVLECFVPDLSPGSTVDSGWRSRGSMGTGFASRRRCTIPSARRSRRGWYR